MNRTLRVRIRFPNPGLMLKPNMYAQVVISNLSDKPVLNIPREALIRVGDTDRVVLALGEGRYKSVNVVAGRNDGNRVEILEGIGKNEQVVTSAQFLLDSESSKTSDFKRMHQPESMSADMKMNMPNDGRAMSGDMKMKMPNDGRAMSGDMKMTMAHDGHDMSGDMKMNMAHDGHDMSAANSAEASATKIWTTAKVNKLLANGRRVNLKHGAVETWNWPPANMNLGLAETVSSKELRPGMDIAIEITRTVAGIYVITDVELPDDIGLPVVQEK
ncbi:copper-binding protein [Aliamphritea spongicola]|nr:copper-binding protein [Aliamphritea spongicola]